jgi:hypothetical protein
MMEKIRRLLTDILGVLLIMAAPLLGWLPGPGGLPLLIAGLTLLSINHEWAKRILEKLKEHGYKFADKLLANNRLRGRVVDAIGILIIIIGLWYSVFRSGHPIIFGVLYVLLGGFLLAASGGRYKKLIKKH